MGTIRVIQNRQRINKNGVAPIYITFYLKSKKIIIPCKISVPIKKFDDKSETIKGNTSEA